jgi:predicted small lipoprotein YifL
MRNAPNKAILTVIVLLTLSGCGIKPGQVASPSEAEKDAFPRTYPSAQTDPTP